MKNYFKKTLLGLSIILATFSFTKKVNAANNLIPIHQCETFDFSYDIYIFQVDSTATFIGAVFDSKNSLIAKYELEERFFGSESLGRKHFIDTNSKGMNFDFSEPSSHFKNFAINALLGDGQPLEDSSINCK